MKSVLIERTFESWRTKARELLEYRVSPHDIEWITETQIFSLSEDWQKSGEKRSVSVPRDFIEEAQIVSCFRDDSTWDLLYRLAYRLVFEDKKLLADFLDVDVIEFQKRARLVGRDVHKMKAFVRFKEVETEKGKVYMAWHRPDHRITKLAANFFKDRFNGMKWIIMTEDETINWDGEDLSFSDGVPEHEAKILDEKEDLWKTYYRAIFNPARIKVSAMKKELPVRHWKTLPETELITSLLDEAPQRLEEFYQSQRSLPQAFERKFPTLGALNLSLEKCKACSICEKANGPVFGEGKQNARMVFVGEQPGDEEDLKKRPFIGPSGQLLNEGLLKANISREDLYVTNAVKGFKWLPKNHQRWHKGASLSEVATCRPWLKQELELVKPEVLVCLGRTAAHSVLGKVVKMSEVRGKIFETQYAKKTIIIPHPASVLRSPLEEQIESLGQFENDLLLIATL
jgi:probable DNA metabolism protein